MTGTYAQLSSSLAGRYNIDREIGRGGMATVFLARDLRHERFVALKVLDPELGAALGSDRFLAEIRVTANLHHPNLLPLFDSGEANGLLFYVMPYVDGESLRARLDRDKQLPVDESIRIVLAVASALEYAHTHGVIHRDLKPENILLHAGQPVVSDFGIALAVRNAGGTRVTQTGLSLGTPQYMSPEQAAGDRAIDRRSDVYSLAAVLYEMLAGEPPHSGQTIQAVIARVLTERPRGVRTMRPSVSEHVEAVVERGLEKLPADRWASAREFADALSGKTDALPFRATAGKTTTPPRAGWRGRLRDPVTLALGATAIAGVVAGVWGWRAATRHEDIGFTVRVPVRVERPPEEGGLFSLFAVSPDGKSIAYAQRQVARLDLWIRSIDQLTSTQVASADGIIPFFSPDGEWLGFRTPGSQRLMKVRLGGGPAILLHQSRLISGASWARGGVIIASIDDRLMMLPDSGGEPKPLVPLDSASGEIGQRQPRVLADGKTVLYQSWRGDPTESRIGVTTIPGGRRQILDLAGGSPIGVLEGQLIYGSTTGSIMAVPFDAGSIRLTGTPVAVIDNVDVGPGGVRAALSYNGTLVYATRRASTQLILADMKGNSRVLVDEPRGYVAPRFSPDGSRLAVSIRDGDRRDVWIHDIASGTTSRVTSGGTVNDRVEWHPDGKRVLYESRSTVGRTRLVLQNTDLSGSTVTIAGDSSTSATSGSFSRNGVLLMTMGTDLHVRNPSGDTAIKPITASTNTEFGARFSPDGKWLAYALFEDGAFQVYVQPFPSTGARYKVTEAGGMTPVWSHDSKRIFYVFDGALHAATVRTAPAFTVVAREKLFAGDYVLMVPPAANYDVSPDGRYFVLLRPADAGDQLTVAHDWKYELRERTRPGMGK